MKKKLKKYQSTGEVKGSKGAKTSQRIAAISGALAGAAGIVKNISDKRKTKKAARASQTKMDNLRKVETENRNSTLREMEEAGTGYNYKKGGAVHKMPNGKMMKGRTHKKK